MQGSINIDGGGFASFRRDFGWFGERNLRDYAGLWVEAVGCSVQACDAEGCEQLRDSATC